MTCGLHLSATMPEEKNLTCSHEAMNTAAHMQEPIDANERRWVQCMSLSVLVWHCMKDMKASHRWSTEHTRTQATPPPDATQKHIHIRTFVRGTYLPSHTVTNNTEHTTIYAYTRALMIVRTYLVHVHLFAYVLYLIGVQNVMYKNFNLLKIPRQWINGKSLPRIAFRRRRIGILAQNACAVAVFGIRHGWIYLPMNICVRMLGYGNMGMWWVVGMKRTVLWCMEKWFYGNECVCKLPSDGRIYGFSVLMSISNGRHSSICVANSMAAVVYWQSLNREYIRATFCLNPIKIQISEDGSGDRAERVRLTRMCERVHSSTNSRGAHVSFCAVQFVEGWRRGSQGKLEKDRGKIVSGKH